MLHAQSVGIFELRHLSRKAQFPLHQQADSLAQRRRSVLGKDVDLDDPVNLGVNFDESADVVADVVYRAVERIGPDQHLAVAGDLVSFRGHEAEHGLFSAWLSFLAHRAPTEPEDRPARSNRYCRKTVTKPGDNSAPPQKLTICLQFAPLLLVALA